MNDQPVVNRLNNIFIWTTRIALLNVIWILFVLFGLVIFGIFPATVASLCICMYWLKGKTDISIWNTFKREFKQSFIRSNGAGWILLVIGIIFFINFQLFDRISGGIYFLSLFSFYFVIILYIFITVWIFPLIAHYKNNLKGHFHNALILGFAKLKYTLLILILIFFVLYISLAYPGIILFFTFGLISLVWAWVSLKVFKEIDEKNAH